MIRSGLVTCLAMFAVACSVDLDGPAVVSVDPASDAVAQANASAVTVVFDEAVEATTAKNAFSLTEDGGGTVAGRTAVTGTKLVFTAETPFVRGRVFRVTVTKAVTDTTGNPMTSDWYSNFRTGDELSPFAVAFVSPTNLAAGVARTSDIVMTFSRPMDTKSVRDNLVLSPQLDGLFLWNAATNTLTFRPVTRFSASTYYTLTIGKETKDATGSALGQAAKLRFATGIDWTPPRLTGIFPGTAFSSPVASRYLAANAVLDDKQPTLVLDFDRPLDRLSAENGITLTPQVAGLFSWNTETDTAGVHYLARFTPTTRLKPGVRYEVTVPQSVKGEDGIALTGETKLPFTVSTNFFVRVSGITDWSNRTWRPGGTMNTITILTDRTLVRLAFAPYRTNRMNIVSVQQNISIKRLFGTGQASKGGQLLGFNWSNGNCTLAIDIGSLGRSNTYLFKLTGSESGIKDSDDNWLPDNVEVLLDIP